VEESDGWCGGDCLGFIPLIGKLTPLVTGPIAILIASGCWYATFGFYVASASVYASVARMYEDLDSLP
jgi:hypothetical protein